MITVPRVHRRCTRYLSKGLSFNPSTDITCYYFYGTFKAEEASFNETCSNPKESSTAKEKSITPKRVSRGSDNRETDEECRDQEEEDLRGDHSQETRQEEIEQSIGGLETEVYDEYAKGTSNIAPLECKVFYLSSVYLAGLILTILNR